MFLMYIKRGECVVFFFFPPSTGNWTQDLVHAKKVLYLWTTPSAWEHVLITRLDKEKQDNLEGISLPFCNIPMHGLMTGLHREKYVVRCTECTFTNWEGRDITRQYNLTGSLPYKQTVTVRNIIKWHNCACFSTNFFLTTDFSGIL